MKFRMYVDEVGNSDLNASTDLNHRYLSLTGVLMDLDHVRDVLHPAMEEMKSRFFDSHPDDPLILHRKELVNRRRPFLTLRNPDIEGAFNAALLELIETSEFTAIAVTIDKLELLQRYQVWQQDPYHYALAALVERYVMWLERRDGQGDVLAESRGGKEDMRLKKSFARLVGEGTDFVDTGRFLARLTSCQLKVKPKQNNIAGLQLADLIAHPIYKAMLCQKDNARRPETFGMTIFRILEKSKLDRHRTGRIQGWGMKWLP